MINKPPPFKGLNMRIPTIIPIKGRGCINHGSTLLDAFTFFGCGLASYVGGFGSESSGLRVQGLQLEVQVPSSVALFRV